MHEHGADPRRMTARRKRWKMALTQNASAGRVCVRPDVSLLGVRHAKYKARDSSKRLSAWAGHDPSHPELCPATHAAEATHLARGLHTVFARARQCWVPGPDLIEPI